MQSKEKYPKETTPHAALILRSCGFVRGFRKGFPSPPKTRGIPAAPLSGKSAQTLRCSARHQGKRASQTDPAINTPMMCVICKLGMMIDDFASITLEFGETILVFKNVPAKVCNNCGEEYFEGNILASLFEQANSPINQSSKIQLRHFIKNELT
ncbi:type II toxin-antitoxin system MqsA family antitoxin [Methylomonas sp. MED-D]|uniref:type II toxin-antitoxin system MqsA family antitoxin n=1 Tax=Methylomonas sp. MED-D TaxID=3418768 RepID=UPI003D051962